VFYGPDCNVKYSVQRDAVAIDVVSACCSRKHRENRAGNEIPVHTDPVSVSFICASRTVAAPDISTDFHETNGKIMDAAIRARS
jgi:hypothetical protein